MTSSAFRSAARGVKGSRFGKGGSRYPEGTGYHLGDYRCAKTATVRAGTVNCPVRGVVCCGLDDRVASVGLHRVQVVALTGCGSKRLGRRFVGGVEHHHEALECSVDVRSDSVVNAHDDHARGLTGAAAGEGHLLLHESFGAQVEQR